MYALYITYYIEHMIWYIVRLYNIIIKITTKLLQNDVDQFHHS